MDRVHPLSLWSQVEDQALMSPALRVHPWFLLVQFTATSHLFASVLYCTSNLCPSTCIES